MRKKAFTMLELVMVIVVMGIVASIGADIIAKLYENYLKTRSINRLQSQTELILDQIAKRLQFRIKDSVRAIDTTIAVPIPVPLTDANASHDVIEWIGISNESFIAGGWSGFIDLDSSDTNGSATPPTLDTNGSDLATADTIIRALTYGDVSLGGVQNPVIIFKSMSRGGVNTFYDNTNASKTVVQQSALGTDIFNVINAVGAVAGAPIVENSEIFEQYYLSHSAYAIVPTPTGRGDFNLTLHYNYQPWYGERYDRANDGNTSLLAENISTFRFTQIGETIRVKLCIHDGNQSGGDYDFSFCKERVIY